MAAIAWAATRKRLVTSAPADAGARGDERVEQGGLARFVAAVHDHTPNTASTNRSANWLPTPQSQATTGLPALSGPALSGPALSGPALSGPALLDWQVKLGHIADSRS